MTTLHEPQFPLKPEESAGRYPWCSICLTDAHLRMISVTPHPRTETRLVEATYACEQCGTIFSHTATFNQVAAVHDSGKAHPL